MPIISPTAISPHRIGKKFDWSSYWATHFATLQTTLDGQPDLNFWAKSRSGNYFVDEYGHNAQIKTPAILCSGTNSYFRHAGKAGITGGAAWDVIFKFRLADISRRDPLFWNGGNANASKGITIMPYNGGLTIYSSDGTNAYRTITMACGFQNAVDYFLRFQWDGQTDGTVTVTVNGTAYTSTNIRGWSGEASEANTDFGNYAGVFRFQGIFRSAIGTFGGAVINFVPNGYLPAAEYETSVSGRVLGFVRYAGCSQCWEGLDTYYLDYGFSWQRTVTGSYLFPVQNTVDGDYVNLNAIIGGGTTTLSQHAGSLTKHNLAPSYIRFVGDFFDRSDTTIWNTTSRESDYYLSGTPKDLYITELNYRTLKSWLNDGYKGMFYIKADSNSVDDTTTIDELFCYATDRKSHDQIKSLIYSNDVRRCQRTIDGDYTFDVDDYAEIYLYSALGGDAEANYTKYQTLLDAGNLTLVTGYNEYDVIAISQPLKPPSGRTLTINCELRIKDGTTVNLTSDVTAGDTVINVDSVAGFNVGEWVSIGDDILDVQGGGVQTRTVASCGRITEIGETTITIHRPSEYNVTAAENGQLGHSQSVILIEEETNVNVGGTGIINGNWEAQYDKEPVNDTPEEEVRMFCGISVVGSSGVNISVETIKNAGLHGIAFWGTTEAITSCVVHGVTATENHDKNILCRLTDGVHIYDVNCTDALFEDGLTLYVANTNFLIERVSCTGNKRSSFIIGNNGACNGVMNDITMSGNFFMYSSGVTINGITILSGTFQVDSTYSQGNNNIINDAVFEDLSQSVMISLLGGISGITFNDLIIDGCTASTAAIIADEFSGSGTYPQEVEFIGGGITNHTGTAFAIDVNADVTFTDFDGAPV